MNMQLNDTGLCSIYNAPYIIRTSKIKNV